MSTTPIDPIIATLQMKMTALGLNVQFQPPIGQGPIVSVYRFIPKGSTRVSHIEGLAQDFAVALSVEDVFVKRMPGETAVGIFVPNHERKYVKWIDICNIAENAAKVPLLLGIDITGKTIVEDLTLLPHLLIAGSTGSGKSTLLGSMICTLLLTRPEIQLYMSDTKGVEFVEFEETPQVRRIDTSVKDTVTMFDQCIYEMERRLDVFGRSNTRNILEYNASTARPFPYHVVIIDELADILTDTTRIEQDEGRSISLGKIASGKLAKLAQKARATGIHVIAATQRPSVKLLEGDIKANFPARISFRLPSEADSRTVLSQGGAEHLLSRGDMLFINPNRPGLHRIHAPLATRNDIKAAVEFAGRR